MFKNILMMAMVSLMVNFGLNAEIDAQTMQQKRTEKYDMKLQQGAKPFIASSDKAFDVNPRGQGNGVSSNAKMTDESFNLKPLKKQFARAK